LDEFDFDFNNYTGDTLELDIEEKWSLKGFDAVIGNPPYQESSNSGERKALNHNLWSDFISKSFELLIDYGYLLHITPCSWMSPTSKNKNIFYKNYIVYLNVNECEKYFKGIGSKFSYYLIKKTNKKNKTIVDCLYDKTKYSGEIIIENISFMPNLVCKESIDIINKFYNNDIEKISFKTSCELHNTTHKNKIKDECDEIFKYPIRHTSKRNIRYSNTKHSLSDKNKILINLSGELKVVYDDGKLGFTQAQLYLLTDNENYINTLKSKLFSFIFKICKWSGFNIDKVFNNIPFIQDKKTDNELYELFNLTKEEIELIESIVKR
jgi:hypothetical protein